MNFVKSRAEIELIREGGERLAGIRDHLLKEIKIGAVPLQIDELAKQLIELVGGSPSFMTVKNYQWATCININDVVVHGIPTNEPFKDGDVVGLDVGLLYKGFHTDTSWTTVVRSSQFAARREVENFLKVGEEALKRAIEQARSGNRVGHISQAIQETVEAAGYSVVRSLVGHGVGKVLHEPPQIPGVVTRPIEMTSLLKSGMVIAIEVIYNMGKPEVSYKNDDGWTLATSDGSISGLFEHTVLISQKEPVILTHLSQAPQDKEEVQWKLFGKHRFTDL